MFTNFQEAKDWIESSIRFGDKLDLSRMKIASHYLGNPEQKFRSLHVAGTNGKGSTTNYLKNILKRHGYKVGIYTSPYVVKFNERIGINDQYISDEQIVDYANQVRVVWDKVMELHNDSITFFEILTLMAFLYFADQGVDYAVIEVGLGGLLDATNIITPEVSLITNISYDHMKQLGNTLESIAWNKLGIVKHSIPLVTTECNEQLQPLFISVCQERQSEISFVHLEEASDIVLGETTQFQYLGHTIRLQLSGLHQVKNAMLAIKAFLVLAERKNFNIDWRNIYQGLEETTWPGRFEIFQHQIILDGAHNIGGAQMLRTAILAMYPNKRIIGLFCMMKDKEHEKVIELFDSLFDEFHFTQIGYKRSATAQELALESHHPKKFVHENVQTAFEACSKLAEDEILVITGSLYFISEIRPYCLALSKTS